MQNLLSELENLLKNNDKYYTEKGLLKNKITELALKSDKDLLSILLSNQVVKNHFFAEIDINNEKTLVFDKEKFISFINNKEFLPGSYTSFKNHIGLKTKNKLLVRESDDVSLVWPYKDCVLEGGQDFEDQKRNEIFYNETLSPDEIDRLFESKVLTNFKKITNKTSNGSEEITSFNDNLIIKGNNLIVLNCLKKKFRNKVKLIYIDPPYNRKNDSFRYNDKFAHSTWLTFIKNRIEIARELLREDGSIWINIDDNESHYLKVLCDGVFGRENFVANIVWQKKYTISNDAKFFSDNHDNILVFAKNIERFKIKGIKRSDEQNKRYTNIDNDPRGPWMSQPLHAKSGLNKQFSYKFNNGFVWKPPRGTYPRYSKDTLKIYEKDNRIWFGKNGTSVPRVKKYLNEMSDVRPATIWLHSLAGNNDQANREVKLLSQEDFSTPKPERLLQRIIDLSSDENDLLLDFFAGSGTTGAVAHKMNRKYILCEQMFYCKSLLVERITKVIHGEQGGISKSIDWQGGGSFIYMELKEWNENYIELIKNADAADKLLAIYERMKKEAFFRYDIDFPNFDTEKFSELPLEDQKNILCECLDKNHLYVNLSEIEDETYKISDEDKKLNRLFYNQEL